MKSVLPALFVVAFFLSGPAGSGSAAEQVPAVRFKTAPVPAAAPALEQIPGLEEIPETPDHPPVFASADQFVRLLIRHLQQRGSVQGLGFNTSVSKDIYTRSFTRVLPMAELAPEDLGDVARAAADEWRMSEPSRSYGYGGGGSRYSVHVGDETSHAFVDVFAHPEGEMTKLEFQIRAVRYMGW